LDELPNTPSADPRARPRRDGPAGFWRPLLRDLRPDSARSAVLLAAILLGALLLRLIGLHWGIPGDEFHFPLHPDEQTNLGAPLTMLRSGDLNPHFFNYGSLHSYLTLGVFALADLANLLHQPADWFVAARLPVIAMAVATVWLCLPLGRRLHSEGAGLLAAATLALTPGHVLHSGFYTVDIPSISFATLALYAALRIVAGGGAAPCLWGGVFAGFAAATKYPMGISLLPVLTALIATRAPRRRYLLVPAAALAAFLLGVPYAVLDFAAFWRDMSFELFEHAVTGHNALFAGTGNGFVWLLLANLPYAVGWSLAIGGTLGLGCLLAEQRAKAACLLAFVLPYVLVLAIAKLRFMRYAIALAPFLALAASYLVYSLRARLGERARLRAVPQAVAVLLVVPLLGFTGRQALARAQVDPRLQARAWLDSELPPGARLGMMRHPNYYTVPVSPFNQGRPGSAYGRPNQDRYQLVFVGDWNPVRLHELAPDWFLISEFKTEQSHQAPTPEALAVARILRDDYAPVARFDNFPDEQRFWIGAKAVPHDWLYCFPSIRVYQRKPPEGGARRTGATDPGSRTGPAP